MLVFIRSLWHVSLTFSPFRLDKKFYEASTIVRWAVVIYDSQRNFPLPFYQGLVNGFLKACDEVGQFSILDANWLDTLYFFGLQVWPLKIVIQFSSSKTAKVPLVM